MKRTHHKIKTALTKSLGIFSPIKKSPEEEFGDLFHKVQKNRVYDDSKTFVDLVPKRRAQAIKKEYELLAKDPNFDLRDFVSRHFYEFAPVAKNPVVKKTSITASDHVSSLWSQLERHNTKDKGSLIALPHEYIVPGGRFNEQFYWDSYFIMLGLAADEEWGKIHSIIKNNTYMIRKFGFIPTANRTYFLSRSQPPFFSQMVSLLASHRGDVLTYFEYLPSLLAEYDFWMKGQDLVGVGEEKSHYDRVLRMPDGNILNRYYDNKMTPRPESQHEDMSTASYLEETKRNKLYLDLRAGAESGWDFSSRWFTDANDIRTIHTTDIAPIDLNCLLYMLELSIAKAYEMANQPILNQRFHLLATSRAKTIRQYFWNKDERFFFDYDFQKREMTDNFTLAGVFPLYANVATKTQAEAVAKVLKKSFLKKGGLVTTLVNNGQQWDSPNGWAPLQWIAIQGLRNYGYDKLANEIKKRWLYSVEKVYKTKHKMIEKYNVIDKKRIGGGGEYPLQDGFGWTNGVYLALKSEPRKSRKKVK